MLVKLCGLRVGRSYIARTRALFLSQTVKGLCLSGANSFLLSTGTCPTRNRYRNRKREKKKGTVRMYDRRLDYREGDIVQINCKNKRYNGKVGEIIGIRYFSSDRGEGMLSYTVKFSDRESRAFSSRDLREVRRKNYEQGRKDREYETR